MSDSELRATFILRLWPERSTPTNEWRGEAEHVQSAHIARFGDRAAVFAHIWSQLAQLESNDAKGGYHDPAID